MTFIRRNRIISTRVSEDEYEEILRISRKHGAHSVSEYLRRVMLNSASGLPAVEACNQGAEIAVLQRKVDWLLHVVERTDGSGPDGSTADAKWNRTGTDNGLPREQGDDV